MKLYNTLTHKKEKFTAIKGNNVGLYTCGPTVYNFAHIGNLKAYLFEDILKRVLIFNGYKVKHVMNITDVGHLVSDADAGEDKMQKALKREGLKPSADSLMKLADRYTKAFKSDLADLNILEPDIWCQATEHVKEMIEMNKKLEKNGYTYETDLALYFDVAKFKNYTQLSRQKLEEKSVGARDDVEVDPKKKHPADFALWFKLAGKNKNHIMHWTSPWGEGFPGWHIECSAMSTKYLGDRFDIHCGGIDHIPVHHTNEIAQNDGAYGHQVVNFWVHGEFLVVGMVTCPKCGESYDLSKEAKIAKKVARWGVIEDATKECKKCGHRIGLKMAKSSDNFLTLQTLKNKNYNPLSYRYLTLTAHYRKSLAFSWEALDGAQAALEKLYEVMRELQTKTKKQKNKKTLDDGCVCRVYLNKFFDAVNDDLNMPKALAIMWDLIKSNNSESAKKATLLEFDKVLGLGLDKVKKIEIPAEIKKLAKERDDARKNKDWERADELREEIEKRGFRIEDGDEGARIVKL
ncbi:cysteine--tRNA ligase [Patescibacteria group bacterium]|nr:cysteine--tRNA ligase [Patescibacteria group bacterium]MBU4512550.1 cysteine--tRNA ligase [Patescibacteria group bacterium]MCG2693064.1 cysteine--tRNA ligase [Candidatus Parcubacteria bacterium]